MPYSAYSGLELLDSAVVVLDHELIDGAPAARFARRLVELIESGYGLGEDQTPGARDTEPARALV